MPDIIELQSDHELLIVYHGHRVKIKASQMRQHRQHRLSLPLHANEAMCASVRLHPWIKEEDDTLVNCINSGVTKWSEMADKLPGRSAPQCRDRWLHHLDPSISKESWTELEDKTLADAQGTLGNQWTAMADKLPGRTAPQCRDRWFRHLDPSISKESWSELEDDTLADAQGTLGNQWTAMADKLPGRTDAQCRDRWQDHLDPSRSRKGRWSEPEDDTLVNCIKSGMIKWPEIAAKLPGRTIRQCRDRWQDHLDPSISKASWTELEDKTLVDAQAKLLPGRYGNLPRGSWSDIAKLLPGRTAKQASNRWTLLSKTRRPKHQVC